MLILETGEGLADAESIVTLDEVRAFASSRGKSVSADDPTLEAQVRSAHDYLSSLENRLLGYRRTEGQALSYPRVGLVIFGHLIAEDALPIEAKNAICQLVIEQATGELMTSTIDGRVIQQEIVGPISTTYAVDGAASSQPSFPRVMAFLQPLMRVGLGLQSIRV